MKLIIAFMTAMLLLISTPAADAKPHPDAPGHSKPHPKGKKKPAETNVFMAKLLLPSESNNNNGKKKVTKSDIRKARARKAERIRAARKLSVARQRAEAAGLPPYKCVTIVKPTETKVYYKTVPKKETRVERVVWGAGLVSLGIVTAAVLFLIIGFIIGWFRSKRDENKYYSELLE